MGKYIDRAALFNSLTNAKTVAEMFAAIQDAPAADVQEVRHGRWERKKDPYGFFDTIPVCSACGCTTKYRETSAYCPHCGAQMDLEENDD